MSRKTGTVDYFYGGSGMLTTTETGEKVHVHESDIIKSADGSFKNLSVGQTVEYEIEKQQQHDDDDGTRNKASKVTAPGGVPLVGGSDNGDFCFRCCKHGHKARACTSEEGHGGGGGH